jgi:pyruvate ferredoxin oxidoreductase gamma subunit/2-oxoisovalerate ferredoxin oxidoreductase gamma subunit
MIEIRFHGRGGQKLGTWAEALALAALKEGKYSQTYLSFGLDRVGMPNTAITRIDDTFVRQRAGNGSAPDIVVVFDPTVVALVDVTAGLKAGGTVIVPAGTSLTAPKDGMWQLRTLDTHGLPVNEARAALLAAVCSLSQGISPDSLQSAMEELKLKESVRQNARAEARVVGRATGLSG